MTINLAITSLCILLAVAAKFDLEILQLDAMNTFVHENLDETVFMKMPLGYVQSSKVLKLNKVYMIYVSHLYYGNRNLPRK